mgnify:CR=1 FL=1
MRKNTIYGIIIITLFIFASGFFITTSMAKEEMSTPTYKYYTSIKIDNGDTLWSIAEKYISNEYESIYDYIRELKQMNNLSSDNIIAGQNITVAYYSDVNK